MWRIMLIFVIIPPKKIYKGISLRFGRRIAMIIEDVKYIVQSPKSQKNIFPSTFFKVSFFLKTIMKFGKKLMGNGNCLETFSTQAYLQNSQYIKSDMKILD